MASTDAAQTIPLLEPRQGPQLVTAKNYFVLLGGSGPTTTTATAPQLTGGVVTVQLSNQSIAYVPVAVPPTWTNRSDPLPSASPITLVLRCIAEEHAAFAAKVAIFYQYCGSFLVYGGGAGTGTATHLNDGYICNCGKMVAAGSDAGYQADMWRFNSSARSWGTAGVLQASPGQPNSSLGVLRKKATKYASAPVHETLPVVAIPLPTSPYPALPASPTPASPVSPIEVVNQHYDVQDLPPVYTGFIDPPSRATGSSTEDVVVVENVDVAVISDPEAPTVSRGLCSYEPRKSDEIGVNLGDEIIIRKSIADGWLVAFNMTTKCEGIVPLSAIDVGKDHSKFF
ncbi:hypothetical protein BDK51DRAFT_31408 [Blyttiomyces helicus]|uniref:SH3 domain-containing protein n=1 Tax=Blyttiomyces helicus TaxID=388810 RepID=A0A4P9WG16_9FUNG|nr:hypothetical protein BDK51DRAFT_31408 [Blyttiomyces helicus]|eukprot:RKO89970.1 hypothetical protein BDK51DRAFT_31408 [Blyttiomyces helicus]